MVAFRVYRRSRAAQDADKIADDIAADSLDSALRFLANLERTLARLAQSPGLGGRFITAQRDLRDIRVSPVDEFPHHLIFYTEHADHIEVIRVLHGARDLEPELRKT